MNVLIVAEKPGITRFTAQLTQEHWPSATLTFVHAVPYGNFKFDYPRGLGHNEFPFISPPRDKRIPWAEWMCPPFTLKDDGALVQTELRDELFLQADLILNACDPDHTGSLAFYTLLHQVFGDDRALRCPTLYLTSCDEATIRKSLAELRSFEEVFAQSLAYGQAKRYFDWNWNINSIAILGKAMRSVGAPSDAPPLSKYALQLLYALRTQPFMTDGRVIDRMHRWAGTGRYEIRKGWWQPSLGSCASRCLILENLHQAGLLERREEPGGRSTMGLSDIGHALLNRLHPDCEDPDLPFRLDAWCNQGELSKPAMDRYIRTFFGKQKRFLRDS